MAIQIVGNLRPAKRIPTYFRLAAYPGLSDNAGMDQANFIQRVQERVDALGVGPVTLALKVGLERNFIRDILEGKKRSVRSSSLRKLAIALEVDPQWLSTGEGTPRSERERRFLERFQALSEDQQEAWLRLLEAGGERDPATIPADDETR